MAETFSTTANTVEISDEDISAGTTITILSDASGTQLSNQGNNQSTTDNINVINTQTLDKQKSGNKRRFSILGPRATGGTVNFNNTKELPDIFFNFREKTFPNTQNLLFKFETSNLASANFTGAKLSTWAANQTISPNISLENVNSPFPLSVVRAYGKYFYQLDRNKSIANVINLPIKTSPSYTILVYAVGKGVLDDNIVNKANVVHSFYDNTNTETSKNFNIGLRTVNVRSLMADIPITYPVASFVGNTLNSQAYPSNNQIDLNAYKNFINIRNTDFYTKDKFNDFLKTYNAFNDQKYSFFIPKNISSFKNNLSNPTLAAPFILETIPGANPPGTVLSTSLNTFSLYFVEMFSGITSSDNQNNYILSLQTFINGDLVYDGSMKLKKGSLINDFGNFKIRLSNMSELDTSADADVKLFLFDYLHGVSNSSFPQMKLEARNITESLAYDYRNIILKSTSDIQLCGGKKSLGFSPALAHPFLNMFFRNIAPV